MSHRPLPLRSQQWRPLAPEAPSAPVAPVSPLSPLAPGSPMVPLSPMAPLAPGSPMTPLSPLSPLSPIGPSGPVRASRNENGKTVNIARFMRAPSSFDSTDTAPRHGRRPHANAITGRKTRFDNLLVRS